MIREPKRSARVTAKGCHVGRPRADPRADLVAMNVAKELC